MPLQLRPPRGYTRYACVDRGFCHRVHTQNMPQRCQISKVPAYFLGGRTHMPLKGCAHFRYFPSPVKSTAELQHAQLRRPFCPGEGLVKTQPEHELLQGGRPLHPGERLVKSAPEEQVLQKRRPFSPSSRRRQRMLPVEVKLKPFFCFAILLFLLMWPVRALPADRIVYQVPRSGSEHAVVGYSSQRVMSFTT